MFQKLRTATIIPGCSHITIVVWDSKCMLPVMVEQQTDYMKI